MNAKYVIIGNSAGAIGGVEGIRALDKEGDIIMVSSESYFTYSRPLISYLLCGETDMQRIKYRSDNFYEENKAVLLSGRTAKKIDADIKCVYLDNGEKIEYQKLLYAAGSKPFIPSIIGLEQVEKKFTFMSLDDALALEQAVNNQTRVLIMGAGLIGLKCAEGLYGRAGSITVVDLADRVLPSILDEQSASIMLEHLKAKGINVRLNAGVKAFTSEGADIGSEIIPFDVLVVAVGVRPNVELLKEAGADCERGIIADERSRTSLKDIYAAGDCTQCRDISCGKSKVLALLPNAYMQGETAGRNMAGGEAQFDKAVPMNSMGVLGLHMVTCGTYDGGSLVFNKDGTYKRLCVKDGLLAGYIILGDVSRAGIYTSLVRERIPLDSIDFKLIAESPQLAAFSGQYRHQKLAERV